jgi:hypothetical protein
MDSGFEVDMRRWADWTRSMPVLVVNALAVSGNQLDRSCISLGSSPVVYV